MKTAEEILKKKKVAKLITVKSGATIQEAIRVMSKYNIGAILIKERDEIVGIWTERDLLRDVLKEDFDPATSQIRDYMSTHLITAAHDDPILKLQDIFLGKRLRHLLIVKKGKIIGLLSAGDVTRASLNETKAQIKSISWDFYENWCWDKNK